MTDAVAPRDEDAPRRERALLALLHRGPFVLLLLVASFQIVASKWARLSPWKGGGFGMFASTDDVNSRQLRYYAVADDGEEFALLTSAGDVEYGAQVLPTKGNFEKVAEALAKLGRPPGFSSLRIELWKTSIAGAEVRSDRWATYRHQLDD